MSRKRLFHYVIVACAWLMLVAASYVCSVYYGATQGRGSHAGAWEPGATCQNLYGNPLAAAIKDLIPLAVALPAAFLAYAFSRRNSYLQALRELWKQLVPSVQKAIQYTYLPAPTQADFTVVMENLSVAIDLTRGVFSNIGKNGSRGLFPYENLKDIHRIISWLGFGGGFCKAKSYNARLCITSLWQEMHHAMLDEFDRDVPATPISKYLYGKSESVADLLIKERGLIIENDKPASHPRC